DRPGIVHALSKSVCDAGCSMRDSRMALLGGHFCGQFLAQGNWNSIAKLEQSLPRVSTEMGLTVTLNRTELRSETRLIPYCVEVLALERPGVMEEVTEFFTQREIGVEDLYSSCYAAVQTGAPMFALTMTVGVPGDISIATLRNEFLELCDDLNLDAEMTVFK
ncbi:MAG: glycine cleavage system protein R, partial [Chromatiales bacterium]|nr:glycine cleavage system protein R [Chromatiales bacterium]